MRNYTCSRCRNTCRCGRTPKDPPGHALTPRGNGPSTIGPGLLFILVSCWPAIFWHGQAKTGGWRWDIHSTVACSVWWGSILLAAILLVVIPLVIAVISFPEEKRQPPGDSSSP